MILRGSILLSAVYFFTIPWHPFPGSWAIKAASVALLALIAARNQSHGVALALALSSIGDALLEYSPGLFVVGLVAFLLAHLTYTATFVRAWQQPRMSAAAVAIVAYSIGLGAWLLPAAGSLAAPVAIYVAAITAMAVSAFTARFGNRWIEIGAVMFLISDSVLAVNRFRMPLPLSGWLVWSTYYLAQLMIVRGALRAWNHRMALPSAAWYQTRSAGL
jgi:uncharacterized membrane protein YhhN